MRVLVLGGTVFLSRTIAEVARDAGHDVTCVSRGLSGNPPEGVESVTADRDEAEGLRQLAGADFDAVIDVERQSPTRVRRALEALGAGAGHWTYVSSGSVYTDAVTPGQAVATSTVEEPPPADSDEDDPELYGPFKVACEAEVSNAVGEKAFLCRAGLIVGPRDTSDRFGYWPARLARGGEILAPGTPEDLVQYIDVRDLAEWIVAAAENKVVGTFDGVAAPQPWGEVLTAMVEAVGGPDASLTWVPTQWLGEKLVTPWAGPDSLPLWLPLPDYAGFMSRDVSASLKAGLTTRSIAEIATAALEWETTLGLDRDRRSGITSERETELLADWHANS
ncbi:MAG: NAD-dependent epimerase/dehydratase family protein [Candidatus Limnocylindrales bacterium]